MADLSNWYLDVIKDRLYVSAADSFDRRAAQTVLHYLLEVHFPDARPFTLLVNSFACQHAVSQSYHNPMDQG